MDPIEMLIADHNKVKGLFRQFEQTEEGQKKRRIAEEAFKELIVHTTLEEELFYPAVQKKAGEEEKDLLAEAYEEHHVVDLLIEELKALGTVSEQYEAKFKVLTENVEHHIEEEEGEMLPDAKKRLGGEMKSLGVAMEKRKKELTSSAF